MPEQGFGERNKLGDIILDYAFPFDLVIENTYFKKREQLIPYKSGNNRSRIETL